jgi:hypothetical protein
MSEQNDHDWIDTLAGRNAAGADPATVKEAQAVRRAVLSLPADQEAQDLDVETGAQKLLFRLRREGLDGVSQNRKSWQRYSAFALAATLLLAAGVVMLQSPPVDDTPVYRGTGAQTINTPDTAGLAATLTAELEALGIQPKVTRFGATYTLSAGWPAKPDAQHAAFLKRNALKQPAGGTLVIELLQIDRAK